MKAAMKARVEMFKSRHSAIYSRTLAVASWLGCATTRRKIRGHGNVISYSGAFLRYCMIDVRGNNNRIEIAPECVLKNVKFMVRGNGHVIQIGPRVRVCRSSLLWCEDEKGTLVIGANTRIEEAHVAVTEPGSRIEIGERCLFAYDIEIRNGDSHSIIDVQSGKRINPPADVKIGDRVWIGMGAKVLKGVTLGDDSIVATSAVVTKSVPARSIAGGNPAKVIREGIRWEYERLQDRYKEKTGKKNG